MRDDETPAGRPPDPRTAGIFHPLEATRRRMVQRWHEARRVTQVPSQRHRARWASEVLADFGDPDCPRDTPPSAELLREARRVLRWSEAQAAWRLGFPARRGGRIRQLESGFTSAPRYARLLLLQALRDLAAQQRAHGGR